jgi:pilus assembly protein CpaE
LIEAIPMLVTIVGGRDGRLEEMIREVSAQVSTVASLDLLLAGKASAKFPDLVLLDTREKAGIPTALATLRRAHPTVGVIVVAESLDPAMMLDAMRAGVSEFLTEPLNAEDLKEAARRIVSLNDISVEGQVFAFVGGKGGVGTTTVAVNVATALARTAKNRVLFVDLHPAYGDAALFFGVEPRFSVLDALENTHRLDEAFLKGLLVRTQVGVDLLASSDRSMVVPMDGHRVRTLLDFLKRRYAYVIVDVPRSDSAVLDALEGASRIVIVANQELSTVRGTARIATTLRQRYGKDHVQIVVSRFDSASPIAQEDVERVVGGSVGHLIPSDYRRALEALNRGCPVVLENHNKLSGSLVGFANRLGGVAPPKKEESAKPTGLLGRLTGRR